MSPKESTEVRVEVDGRTLKLSNLDKVLYPRTGTTKGEVLNYYAQVSPAMLPLLANRCATRVRWPNGVEKQSFFEKNIPGGTPSWVRTAEVPTTGSRAPSRNGDVLVFPIVDDLATLTWLANLAALELHVHQWTVTKAGKVAGREPARHRPRPGRRRGPPRVLPGRPARPRAAGRAQPRDGGGDQRQQGPAPVRRPPAAQGPRRLHRRWPRRSPRTSPRSTAGW